VGSWLFEPKWDGYRALCYFGETVKFISRRKNDLKKRFPELQTIQVKAESAIIDGEITANRRRRFTLFRRTEEEDTANVCGCLLCV
jgi:ATP-dependent DNA ligase